MWLVAASGIDHMRPTAKQGMGKLGRSIGRSVGASSIDPTLSVT